MSGNPSWCKAEMECEADRESFCKGDGECYYYNPKMTFFEAWEKAKEGDILKHTDSRIKKEAENGICYIDSPHLAVWQKFLFEKEWTIIPQKKTVTVEIPEGAENVSIDYTEGKPCLFKNITKITYEIEEK